MTTTIHDIARACGLNASTVSRALNDDPRVKEKTRERIRQCAREMDYRPNQAARNLASGRTNSLWLIVPSMFSPLEQEQSMHISRFVREKGLDLLVALYHNEPDIYERLLRQLEMKLTDGAFVLTPSFKTPVGASIIKRLNRNKFPLVFLDRLPMLPNIPTVTMVTDNSTAVKRLADACLEQGAEAVYPIFQELNSASRERRDGLSDYPCITKVTTQKKVAILASSSVEIAAILPELHRKHPDTIFMAGAFDYWLESHDNLEKIIVMPQDFEGMARNGVETLLTMLNHPEHKFPSELRTPAMAPKIVK